MSNSTMPRRFWFAALAVVLFAIFTSSRVLRSAPKNAAAAHPAPGASARAAQTDAAPSVQLDPTHITYKLPAQIQWTGREGVAQTAVLVGDPMKSSALYVELVKWFPHNMSHPHFHPNDRYITVLSGTWWVGTGSKFDPNQTVPMPAGSFVTDLAGKVHYDGAKDETAIIEIVGIGPATMTPAEEK